MTNFKYNIRQRELKKGKVYDVFFYEDTLYGKKHKHLSGFKTKKEAEQAYFKYMQDKITAAKLKADNSIVMYEDARKVYLSSVEPLLKESSLYDFKHTGSLYYDVFFAKKDMMTITKQDVLEFHDWLNRQKKANGEFISAKTVAKVYGQYRAFHNWCVTRFNIPDVCTKLSIPKRKIQKREYTIWTQDDFNQFIAEVDTEKYVALFTTLFYSGCRVGELQACKVSDYDGISLHIHATYSKKTLDGTPYKITETKNYKARCVPLPMCCRKVLNEFVKNRKPNEFLFGGMSPLSLNTIRFALDKGIAKSGVPKIRIHDLRHSYVSLLISKGGNFAVVASLIGDTLDQVIKTYAHSIEEDKIKIISLIN